MKSEKKYTEIQFLEMFSEVKSSEKGRKSTTRMLIGRTESNFKKLIKAGYTPEEFRKATIQMFRDKEQWAILTNNDNPEHLLQPNNFGRYLNAAENLFQKKKVLAVKKEVPKEEEVKYSADEIKKSRLIYETSLKKKKWLGTISDAMKIGIEFSNSFTSAEKNEFLRKANEQIAKPKEQKTGGNIDTIINRIAERYPRNIMFEIAVKEAVKRNIKEPWKSI